jgi:hypothetical protein
MKAVGWSSADTSTLHMECHVIDAVRGMADKGYLLPA